MNPLSESVGRLIKPSKLRRSYWEAIGPMQELFVDDLAQVVRDYLDRCMEPPPDYLYWSIYMRGPTAERAKPYLVFSSEDRKTRSRACQMVRESDILGRFPMVKITHSRYPPELNNTLLRLLCDHSSDRSWDATFYTTMADRGFHYKPTNNLDALELFIEGRSTEEPARRATAGGIICVGTRFCYLTVYHILEQDEYRPGVRDNEFRGQSNICGLEEDQSGTDSDQTAEEEEEDVGDSGFEDASSTHADGISTSGENEIGPSEASTQMSKAPRSGDITDNSNLSVDPSTTAQVPLRSAASRSADQDFTRLGSRITIESKSLDYMLLEIHDEDQKKANSFTALHNPSRTVYVQDIASIGNRSCSVFVLSACHGISRGTLFATPRFMRSPKTLATNKMFSLQLDRHVQSGDSGSWVVDAASGHFYGHIFGGGIGTKIAYIMPANEIFEDLRRQSRQPVFLPSAHCEKHSESDVAAQSSLPRLLQPATLQASESGSRIKEPQRTFCNTKSKRVNDDPQIPSTGYQGMDEATRKQIFLDTTTHSTVPSSDKRSPTGVSEICDVDRAPTSTRSKSSFMDDGASCWSYKPK